MNEEILFEGSHSWRKPIVLFAGVFSSGMASYALYVAIRIAEHQKVSGGSSWMANSIFVGVVGCFFMFLGVWMLVRFFVFRKARLEITDKGITYGRTHSHWEDIQSIGCTPDGEDYQLYYRRKGSRRSIELGIDYCLTDEGYEKLTDLLRMKLSDRYPKLEIAENGS